MASSSVSPPQSPVSSNSTSGRRLTVNRSMTAPEKMAINGHFASAGQNGEMNFEHGVQVIDEDKDFKCANEPNNPIV